MAGIADVLIGQAGQAAQAAAPQGNLGQSIATGVELAQKAEQLQTQNQQLAIKKAELQQAKWEKVGTWFDTYSKMPDGAAKKAFGNDFIPNGINALGMSDQFNPTSLKMLQSDSNLSAFLIDKVRRGDITQQQLSEAALDPEKMAKLIPDASKFGSYENYKNTFEGNANEFDKAGQFAIQAANTEKNAKLSAQAQSIRANSMAEGVEIRRDEQAANAVNKINTNPAITGLQTQSRNITKGLNLLNNGKPSVTTINEVAQDFSAALSNAKASSDFKLKQIETHTLQGELQKLKQYISSNPDQPAPPEVVKFWKDMGERLDVNYHKQIGAQAAQLSRSAETTYKNNPQAVKAVKDTERALKTGAWAETGSRVQVAGKLIPLPQAKAFYKANPQFLTEEKKKELEDADQ